MQTVFTMFGHVQHHAQTQHTLKQLNYIGHCTHIFVLHFHNEDLALEGYFVDSRPESKNQTNVTQKTSSIPTLTIATRMHMMSTANPPDLFSSYAKSIYLLAKQSQFNSVQDSIHAVGKVLHFTLSLRNFPNGNVAFEPVPMFV